MTVRILNSRGSALGTVDVLVVPKYGGYEASVSLLGRVTKGSGKTPEEALQSLSQAIGEVSRYIEHARQVVRSQRQFPGDSAYDETYRQRTEDKPHP